MNFTSAEIRTYYAVRVPSVKITSFREWRGPCPVHQGKDPNFSVNAETGLAQCHSQCGRGWDMISLEMELSGLDFSKAKDRVFEIIGRPRVPWEERDVEAIYDYTDADGKLLYQVLRKHGKQFKQRRPDGAGGWIWNLGNVERVPYRLPRVRDSEFVGICEGEKDVLTLERLGLVGSCNNGGAGNFRPELVQYFTDKHIAIFPDSDEPGREHALKVAALLAPVAKTLKVVELPGLPAKGDLTDFVNAGGTVEQIREQYRNAQPWTPEWEFAINLPDENEKYVRTIEEEIEAAGGLTAFWDLAKFTGLPTPFRKLNSVLGGGMRPGEVYVIGANPYVFHGTRGSPVDDHLNGWTEACERAGLPGLLFHDLRRSAVRNMKRAGIQDVVAMKIGGHKTRSIFEQYCGRVGCVRSCRKARNLLRSTQGRPGSEAEEGEVRATRTATLRVETVCGNLK